MTRPTLYLTNAASRKPPHRGPGRVLTIMAAPRAAYGEAGEGSVPALVPPLEWVQAAKAGTMPLDEYRRRYVERLAEHDLGVLAPEGERGPRSVLGPDRLFTNAVDYCAVRDGDTLVCACSRADAAEGRCHRVWAAEALVRAGWRVVLDGVELEVPDAR